MLTKRQRRQFTKLHSRQGRRKSDFFLVEGMRCCQEAWQRRPGWLQLTVFGENFAATADGENLLRLARQHSAEDRISIVPDNELEILCETQTPQGVCCLMRRPNVPLPDTLIDPFALVLDRIREPGNMGTILRTAWAAGLTHVWLTEGCVDPFSAKVVRAGMGAHFALTLVKTGPLSETQHLLQSRGCDVLYLAVPDGGISCFEQGFDLAGKALVIGNEAEGILDLSLGPHVSIPMPGNAESLNASQAATILIFEGVRRGLLKS